MSGGSGSGANAARKGSNSSSSPTTSIKKLRSSNDDLTKHRNTPLAMSHGHAPTSAAGESSGYARAGDAPVDDEDDGAGEDVEFLETAKGAGSRRGSLAPPGNELGRYTANGDGHPGPSQRIMGGIGNPPAPMMMSSSGGPGEDSLAQRKALWWKNVLVTGMFILAWYTFATLLSLYNKWMFSDDHYGFSYPLFVTACHMAIQAGLAALVRQMLPVYKPKERPTRQDYVVKIIPCAFSTGGDIGLSNLSLKTITLSLYTMCKSSTLIFVLFFAFTFRLEAYSIRLVSVILLISIGVFLMVFDTTSVSVPGIVMVFSASAFAGLRWALTETLMHKRKMGLGNPFATIFWLSPISGAVLVVVSMIVEDWAGIFGKGHFDGLAQSALTIGAIVLPGGIAFAMVSSEYFIIQRAGVVPLSIAGIVKEVSTIMISAWVFGDELTNLNIVGVAVAVSGITLYSFHKYQKSMSSSDSGLASGRNPTEDEEAIHLYAPARTSVDGIQHNGDGDRAPRSLRAGQATSATPAQRETTERRREETPDGDRWDNDGWDENWKDDDDEDEEDVLGDDSGDEEVLKQRARRESERRASIGTGSMEIGQANGPRPGSLQDKLTRSWGPWWDESM